jgi:hypothetical protein
MFLPFKDLNPTRTFPFVNYLLIAANIAGYAYESLLIRQSGEVAIVAGYGLVATRLLTDPLGEAFTILVTCSTSTSSATTSRTLWGTGVTSASTC